jgi:hypothetical protein
MAAIHLVRDVLDKVLRDKNGRECGRADSILVEVRHGAPAVATHLEAGLFVTLRRVSERLANVLQRAASLLPVPLESAKIPLDRFSHESHFVDLPIDGEADPHLLRTEKWLRSHVIARIPKRKGKKPE